MSRAIPVRDLPTGWTIAEIDGRRCVPDYPYAAMAAGMDPMMRRQELDLDWTATSGKVVYPEFGEIHCAVEPLPFDHRRPLVLGWDLPAATGGTKAMVPTQVSPTGQWMIYPPIVEPENRAVGVYEFGEWVAQHLYEEFAQPNGIELSDLQIHHYADPAGAQRPVETIATKRAGTEQRSAFEILRDGDEITVGYDEWSRPIIRKRPGFGWLMMPGAVSATDRQESIRARLTTLLPGGVASLVVDPAATMILEGFKGAYNYPQRADGRYEIDPGKNHHSHPMDALSYPATRLFAAKPKRDREDDGYRAPTTRGVGRRKER